jgi:hypothetical protein
MYLWHRDQSTRCVVNFIGGWEEDAFVFRRLKRPREPIGTTTNTLPRSSMERSAYNGAPAENRMAELETNVRYYQDRTERAEEWLHKIFTEIEEQFFRPGDKHRGVNGSTRPIGRRA